MICSCFVYLEPSTPKVWLMFKQLVVHLYKIALLHLQRWRPNPWSDAVMANKAGNKLIETPCTLHRITLLTLFFKGLQGRLQIQTEEGGVGPALTSRTCFRELLSVFMTGFVNRHRNKLSTVQTTGSAFCFRSRDLLYLPNRQTPVTTWAHTVSKPGPTVYQLLELNSKKGSQKMCMKKHTHMQSAKGSNAGNLSVAQLCRCGLGFSTSSMQIWLGVCTSKPLMCKCSSLRLSKCLNLPNSPGQNHDQLGSLSPRQ